MLALPSPEDERDTEACAVEDLDATTCACSVITFFTSGISVISVSLIVLRIRDKIDVCIR